MAKRVAIIIVSVIIVCGLIYLLSPKTKIKSDNQNTGATNINTVSIECERNSDCLIGGCSNTVCMPRDKVSQTYTTCEWQPEYACYAQDSCGCNQGRCQWAGSEAYGTCISQLK